VTALPVLGVTDADVLGQAGDLDTMTAVGGAVAALTPLCDRACLLQGFSMGTVEGWTTGDQA